MQSEDLLKLLRDQGMPRTHLALVVYRSGSVATSTTFFDEFADRLDHVTTYSPVVIMGDVNFHLDVPIDASTSNFSSLLAANNLVQVVQSPTHTAGHLLDVVIVDSAQQ